MGYHTDFYGEFEVTPPLKPEHLAYLQQFSKTRRMKRDPLLVLTLPDRVREAVGLEAGAEGEYFVGGLGFMGQDKDPSLKDLNRNPTTQPGFWCQWEPNEEGTVIRWDGGEKFYYYVEWIQYIIQHFMVRWGYQLNGEVEWTGEDSGDFGKIEIADNVVTVYEGHITYTPASQWTPNSKT